MALDFLVRLADGLTQMFGKNCEVVIHDMNNFKNSILYIKNNHVTNRQVSEKFKILGIKDVDEFFNGKDLINCNASTADKRLLKSSTFHLKGEDYHYAFGINLDYTHLAFAQSIISDLIHVGEDINDAINDTPSPEVMLEKLLEEALRQIGKPISMLSKKDRIFIVQYLEEKGAFNVQKAIPMVSEKLNISRYTIYNYLKEIKKN